MYFASNSGGLQTNGADSSSVHAIGCCSSSSSSVLPKVFPLIFSREFPLGETHRRTKERCNHNTLYNTLSPFNKRKYTHRKEHTKHTKHNACIIYYVLYFDERPQKQHHARRREKWGHSAVFFCNSAFDESVFIVCVFSIITFCGALFSHSSIILSPIDKSSVFFVRWFRAPFFEQVVFALEVHVVTSESDESPVVKRHFRLFA